MWAPLFLAFFIYATMLWTPCELGYKWDTETRMRAKLTWMSRELMIDAAMKIKAVQRYRDQYYKSLQYQLGDTVYEMRDIFKKVVKIYQAVDRNVSYGPITTFDGFQNANQMVRVHRMCAEIENKVIMVQTWHRKRESKEERHDRMLAALRSGTNQHYDELEDVPLRELQVRQRMARARGPLPGFGPLPRAPAPHLGDKRNIKKWRHVRDDDFVRRSI